MGLLSSGQTMLASVMTAEGQSVAYRRGATSLTITATPDGPNDPSAILDGLGVVHGEMDFAINVADLTIGLPQDGDMIYWTIGSGNTYNYKVLKTDNSRCYDWLDNHRARLTVHTKLDGVSNAI